MKMFTRSMAAFALVGMLATTACSTDAATHTTTFNVSEFASDAQAVAYASTIIANLDVVKAHIGKEDSDHINTILADIKSITSQAAANSNGSITVDTGKTWVKSLAGELQNLLAITAPIVKQYDATAASYMNTVSEMIPLIEALAGITSIEATPSHVTDPVAASPVKVDATGTFVPDTAPSVRAKIYAGFTPTVSLPPAQTLRGQIYSHPVSVKK